ncbi:MAG: zinc ribbon domain-containing protein [Deltaproteobacteria bacterium]|jgi:predicted amidophosphoribosyltransferase|nr:zinc ribbon domain-containing protein [Deltaproteobacteria bacterium]
MELICEECGAPVPSDTCEKCQNPAPLWAKFCPNCGNDLAPKRTSVSKNKTKRQLCSDESCIGIIGEDGVCTECGKRP